MWRDETARGIKAMVDDRQTQPCSRTRPRETRLSRLGEFTVPSPSLAACRAVNCRAPRRVNDETVAAGAVSMAEILVSIFITVKRSFLISRVPLVEYQTYPHSQRCSREFTGVSLEESLGCSPCFWAISSRILSSFVSELDGNPKIW